MAGQRGHHPNKETLSAYADRELPPAERAPIERHLAACAECRALVAQFRGAGDFFQHIPAQRPPDELRRAVWRRVGKLDEQHRRHRWLPGGNALGLALVTLLLLAIAPQMSAMLAALRSHRDQSVRLAAAPVPMETEVPLTVPPLADPSPGVATAVGTPVLTPPAMAAAATTTTAGAVTTPATSAAGSAAAAVASATAGHYRVVGGLIAAVNRSQRTMTVADAGTKTWQFDIPENTLFIRNDGKRLAFTDVGVGDQVEVTGLEATPAMGATGTPAAALTAAQVKVVASVALANQAPHVLVLLDGAGAVRAPQYGFTGDWIKRLNDTGYVVSAQDPSTVAGAAALKGFNLIVIGYPATLSNTALQAVKASQLPVLLGDPRLVQPLGLGQNLDPAQPAHMVQGKSVDIPPQAGMVTRGFGGETDVATDVLYRTPIVANGTVLATIPDAGQKLTVWSVTGHTMYFGFWYSNTGQNHNATYWALFDRSVLFLLDVNPLAPTPTPPITK